MRIEYQAKPGDRPVPVANFATVRDFNKAFRKLTVQLENAGQVKDANPSQIVCHDGAVYTTN